MNIDDMAEIISQRLTELQNQNFDKDCLPQELQNLGMQTCGTMFAMWDLPDIDGHYHFEVRLAPDPDGPFIIEWIYRPVI